MRAKSDERCGAQVTYALLGYRKVYVCERHFAWLRSFIPPCLWARMAEGETMGCDVPVKLTAVRRKV